MKTGARQAALEILERCRRDKAWSAAGIDSAIKKYGFDSRDASLTAMLCLGVQENMTLCDFYISAYCTGKLEPKVRDILRMGVYQLLFLDRIPARAAVNESVELCRRCGFERAAGLVNAVLRKVSDNMDCLPKIPGKGTSKYLSIKYSHPLWLCEKLVGERGYDFTEAFLSENNRTSPLTIQVNTLKTSVEDYENALSDAGIEYISDDSLPGCLTLSVGNALSLPGFGDGLCYVQDKAARTAAFFAGVMPGMTVLDACASPGGKSFASAIAMKNRGEILSCDIHEKKLRLISEGAERLGIGIISTCEMDARRFDASLLEKFDAVIADVPCSGMGVIGKKPEIRQKTAQEISGLPGIQRDIINNLSNYVKKGGVLLYSTCTVLHEENEDIVNEFLSSHPEFCPENLPGRTDGMYTFWPNVDGTDGFFAAKLRKI